MPCCCSGPILLSAKQAGELLGTDTRRIEQLIQERTLASVKWYPAEAALVHRGEVERYARELAGLAEEAADTPEADEEDAER